MLIPQELQLSRSLARKQSICAFGQANPAPTVDDLMCYFSYDTFMCYIKHLLGFQSTLQAPRYSYFYLSESVLYTVRSKYGEKIQSYPLPAAEGQCPTDI